MPPATTISPASPWAPPSAAASSPAPASPPATSSSGWTSSGVHANGFSLVRRVVERAGLALDAPAPFAPSVGLAEALLTPTRIYVRSCLAAIATGGVRALAHITGGGLVDNIPRVLPVGLGCELDMGHRPDPRFRLLARTGDIPWTEMVRTFNCGLGMIVTAAARRAGEVEAALVEAGESVHVVGQHRRACAAGGAGDAAGGGAPVVKLRLGVLISGRGSNLQALIDACADPAFPAAIALVVSNEGNAYGLARAAAAGIATTVVDHRDFPDRPAFDDALTAALAGAGVDLVCPPGSCGC